MKKIFAICLVFLFPTMALAQLSQGVRCVQDQLNAAGFDAGPNDGQAGPATRRAIAAFQQSHETVSSRRVASRRLDVTLGNSFCRTIGNLRPDLRAFWPSRESGHFELKFTPSVGPDLREMIGLSLESAYTSATANLQVELAGIDTIIVGSTPSELRALIREHAEIPLRISSQRLTDACGSFRGISGGAAPGLMWLCAPADPETASKREKVWLDFLLAHEAFHMIQFQLSGAIDVKFGSETVLNFHGPVWLSEGSAQAFGSRFSTYDADWRFRIVNYRQLEGRFPDLKGLEAASSLKARKPAVYRAGTVASIDLIDLFGYPKIAAFYENLGRGLKWKAAFEDAFGITVVDFYYHYANVPRFLDSGDPIPGPLKRLVADPT